MSLKEFFPSLPIPVVLTGFVYLGLHCLSAKSWQEVTGFKLTENGIVVVVCALTDVTPV